MTITQARQRAARVARERNDTRYVVYDPSYRDELPERSYWVSDEYDLETWFAGAQVLAVFEANGDSTNWSRE